MLIAILGGMLAAPALVFLFAFFRATILFYPTMIILGMAHSKPGLEWIPALGWDSTFILIALLSILVPTGTSASND
jgi:hypothetical protein